MKSLVRWSATLGLVGTTLLGSFFGGNLRALALTEQQVMEKLQTVPVFTVTDGEGSPLVASIPNQNNQNEAVAGVFISQRDAEAFVERLKREKPELGNQVRVVPVSLAEVYQLDQQSQNQPNGLDFAYIPVQQQVQSAQQLLPQGQEFRGVPLFVAKGGQQGGYLTIQQEGQQVIPFFFDKEQLQNLVNRFKEQQPNLASSVQIQVVPLEGIINTLQTQDNPQLEQILLIPSQESLQFLRQSSSQ
ncbi:MAG: Tic22 family protein [Coleofasciculus sp. B1-GNL1-01]|uniref:Tic22 family protein n=1 Tax=Coleofasciculus sp. B1-GNL1-01 TaxID=3068484 RepID=UPI0032FEEBA7